MLGDTTADEDEDDVVFEHEWDSSRPGPDTALTPQLVEAVCKLVREGTKPLRAMRTLGVIDRDWYRWRAKARDGVEPYTDRIATIDMAESQFLCESEMCLGKAARIDWKAAKEMLKARLPSEYGDKLDITSGDQQPVKELTHEELIAEAVAMGLPTTIFESAEDTEPEIEITGTA